MEKLLTRHAARSAEFPFNESPFGMRSAVWPPTTTLVVAHERMEIRVQRSSGVTVQDVLEAFAVIGAKKADGRVLLSVGMSEYAWVLDARLVLSGRYA